MTEFRDRWVFLKFDPRSCGATGVVTNLAGLPLLTGTDEKWSSWLISSEGDEMLAFVIFLCFLLVSFLYDRILTFSVMEFRDEADAMVLDWDFVLAEFKKEGA